MCRQSFQWRRLKYLLQSIPSCMSILIQNRTVNSPHTTGTKIHPCPYIRDTSKKSTLRKITVNIQRVIGSDSLNHHYHRNGPNPGTPTKSRDHTSTYRRTDRKPVQMVSDECCDGESGNDPHVPATRPVPEETSPLRRVPTKSPGSVSVYR